MKVLLIGGEGFIGASTAYDLLKEGYEIGIFGKFTRVSKVFEKIKNKVYWKKGDVLNKEDISKVLKEFSPDILLHLAAIAGIDTTMKNPIMTFKVNFLGTFNVLESVIENDINLKQFIFFSTSEVFGAKAYNVCEADPTHLLPVGKARALYSLSKLAGEHMCYAFSLQFGINYTIIRPFNVFGPGQIGEGAIQIFIKRALKNEDLIVYGDGSQIRAWCYISDMVEGIKKVVNNPKAFGDIFNIGNPANTITIRCLAEKVIHLAQSKSKIIHKPLTYTDIEIRVPNIDKAKQILGFQPKVNLDEGILKTIEWYKNEDTN